MGADASIYGMIRPQAAIKLEDPDEIQAKRLTLQNLMQQSEVGRLGLEQTRRGMERDDAFTRLFSGGRTPTEAEMYGVDPTRAAAALKAKVDLRKTAAEAGDKETGTLEKSLKIHYDQLKDVNDPQAAAKWILAGYNDPMLSPILQRTGSPQEVISRIPQDPKGFEDWLMRNGMGLEKFAADIREKQKIAETGRHNLVTEGNAAGQLAVSRGNLAETRRHHGATETQAAATAERDRFGPLTEVTGPDGKPMLVMQNRNSGAPVDPNTRQPISGVGPKAGETAQKQQVGVQNTKAAITEYKNALAGFAPSDIMKPDARARMGTVYNNMLLQAKEAFNLGVLNGPDYMILQEVITNPTTLKGGITSKEALNDQAVKLDEIMGRIGQQITTTQTGRTPAATPVSPVAPSRSDIEAELRRRGAIK